MYSAYIGRRNPTCLVVLVDQSASMANPFGRVPEKSMSEVAAAAVNRLLKGLCIKCARSDGISELFQVGVIGYGRRVQSALAGPLTASGLVKISELADNPARIETRTHQVDDGKGGMLTRNLKFPIWIDPIAEGEAPMRQAFELAGEWVSEFLGVYPGCHPPLVINLTGGGRGPVDEETSVAAAALRELKSSDGDVLLFHAHMTEGTDLPILFPADEQSLPSEFDKQLFRMSSDLPPTMVATAQFEEIEVRPNSRGFVFNADLAALVSVSQFGDGYRRFLV